MTLDWQQIVNILVTAGFACVGYFYSQIISDTKKDRQMLNDLRVDLPTKYVSKDDLKHDMDRLIEMMIRLEDKIDRINK